MNAGIMVAYESNGEESDEANGVRGKDLEPRFSTGQAGRLACQSALNFPLDPNLTHLPSITHHRNLDETPSLFS